MYLYLCFVTQLNDWVDFGGVYILSFVLIFVEVVFVLFRLVDFV